MGNDKEKRKINFTAAALVMAGAGTLICLTGFAMGGRPGFYTTEEGLFTAEGICRKKNGEVVNVKNRQNKTKRMEKAELAAFDSIQVSVHDADIEIIPSDGYYAEYCIRDDSSPELISEDGTLTFHENEAAASDSGEFYQSYSSYFWFYDSRDFDWKDKAEYYVKIYVPENAVFTSAEITAGAGDVKLADLYSGQLKCKLSFGNLQMNGWKGDTAKITLGNGDMEVLGNLDGSQSCTIENSFGNVRLNTVTSPSCTIDMGNRDLYMTMGANTALNVTNSFGNTEVSLDGKLSDYDIYLNTAFGKIRVPDNTGGLSDKGDENSRRVTWKAEGSPRGSLNISAGNGDIHIKER